MVAGAVSESASGPPEFGPYRILGLLGQGGMGLVHRAHDTGQDRLIALKRLPVSVTEQDFRARFRRESRIVANLRHPNVIPVHDFGEIDGQLFLDMMLVDGTDLRRAMGAGTVDLERTIEVLLQVAEALDAAHTAGLVHRDVKPSNILIDSAGHAYLADFGIARETSPDATVLTGSGELIGSWDYMAPERLSGGPVDGRADQYSLACVLFECLTGRLPHPAVDPAAKAAAHLLRPPPAPSVFAPTITPALDTVVMRGLAKDPARRFPTATALMTAAREAAYSGETRRVASPTQPGPSRDHDQGRLVRAIVRSTAARQPTTRRAPDHPPTCPYPGLRGFDSVDADWFHGRAHVVTDLLVRLAEQLDVGEPVVLIGASGAGKSSVLRAGLLPALATADAPEQHAWPQIVCTPGADPVSALAVALAAHTSIVAAEWVRVIRETPDRFGELCARAVEAGPGRPVIVVDQFEELFTHGTNGSDRLAFATALANARPALVVLAIRADMVERCIELAPLVPALNSPVLLGPMDDVALRQAIVQPARNAGMDVEPGLAERLITDLGVRGDVAYDPGSLPRLAHALRETWNHGDGRSLTLAAYRQAGGIDGAVARTAEEIHDRLDPTARQALRTMLLRLVIVFDDGGVARRRVPPRDLVATTGHSVVLDRLIAARLVTVDASGARLAHEALLSAWPRLRDWIDEDRAGLSQYRRFTEAVRAWVESGGHTDDLYRGVRLATLNAWLESATDRVRLHPAEQDFLARSNAEEQAGVVATRRRTRRLRVMVASLSVLLVVASAAVVVATRLRQDAVTQRSAAQTAGQLSLSRQLAAESGLARGVDPEREALDALGAWQAGHTVEARSALLGAQEDSYRGELTGHTAAVTATAVSADSEVAVTGGRDGTLRLWNILSRRAVATLATGGQWYHSVSLSDDGRLLAAVELQHNSVSLWDVPGRRKVFTPRDLAVSTAVSPDGSMFAASTDRGVVVWDTHSFTELYRIAAGATLTMEFSPDGSEIAMAHNNNVDVYRVSDGTRTATLTGDTSPVTSLDFDRSGSLLVSASSDGAVRLWNARQWTRVRALAMPASSVTNAVVLSPDGGLVVAGAAGTATQVWDARTGALLEILTPPDHAGVYSLAVTGDGHTLLTGTENGPVAKWTLGRSILGSQGSAVDGVAYQPHGRLLATVNSDGSVRLWNAATGDLVRQWAGHTSAVLDVAFSPDGTELATVDEDGTLIVWNPSTGAELRRFSRAGARFGAVAFSPDGRTIAVASLNQTSGTADHDEVLLVNSADLTVRAEHPTANEPRNTLPNGDALANEPEAVAFSPNGHTLAIALSGGRIGLWNLTAPDSAWTTLPGHTGEALDVRFSPDGTILASSGADRTVRLWQVRDGRSIGTLTQDAAVREVAFSPDGTTLATAAQDTVLRIWDVRTRAQVAQLDRHADTINDVEFDPLLPQVATASADGTTRLWDLSPEDAVNKVCGLLDQATLAEHWRALGPGRGDPPTCP